MDEAKWLVSQDPAAMLLHLRGNETHHATAPHYEGHPATSDRKLRLWVDACRNHAKGSFFTKDLNDIGILQQAVYNWSHHHVSDPTMTIRADLLRDILGNPCRPVTYTENRCRQCEAIGSVRSSCNHCEGSGKVDWRGINPAWLTPLVLSLTRAAYDETGRECDECKGKGVIYRPITQYEREDCEACHGTGRIDDGTLDPFRLALLSDALEESGCDDALLAHLRSPGPHVRGCHVVDLILGET